MIKPRAVRIETTRENATVTPLELFFDLVFVFALTQVTAFMAHDLTAHGIVRGLLILAVLWWSWTGYAWLFNVVRADEGVVRAILLTAMTVMFVMSLAIPEAFDDLPGGLPGPVVVALCYFAFRMLHLASFWLVSSGDSGLRSQLVRFTPSVIGGTTFLLLAAQFDGWAQTGFWALALLADYGGTFLGGAAGWRLRSAGQFAERHGLILIVALGESLVSIGVGVTALPISWPIVAASVLGLAVAASMWWAYFDVTALLAERALAGAPESDRARLARDAYSFLHMPLVLGIVLVALGLKKVLQYVGDTGHHELGDPLTGIGLYALFGGVALYLLAHVAFKYRMIKVFSVQRLIAGVALLAAIPLAARVPALAALGMLAAMTVALIAFETARFAAERDIIRHQHEHASEQEQQAN